MSINKLSWEKARGYRVGAIHTAHNPDFYIRRVRGLWFWRPHDNEEWELLEARTPLEAQGEAVTAIPRT